MPPDPEQIYTAQAGAAYTWGSDWGCACPGQEPAGARVARWIELDRWLTLAHDATLLPQPRFAGDMRSRDHRLYTWAFVPRATAGSLVRVATVSGQRLSPIAPEQRVFTDSETRRKRSCTQLLYCEVATNTSKFHARNVFTGTLRLQIYGIGMERALELVSQMRCPTSIANKGRQFDSTRQS